MVEAVELPKTTAKKDSLHLREKDLENHFETEEKSATGDAKKDEKKGDKKDDKKDDKTEKVPSKLEDNLKADYQVLRALDLLKGWELIKSMGSDK